MKWVPAGQCEVQDRLGMRPRSVDQRLRRVARWPLLARMYGLVCFELEASTTQEATGTRKAEMRGKAAAT
jgi:hypothetical protein